MTLYTRQQLLVLLLLTGAAGIGLGVDHWRRARPELVERLETLDRAVQAVTAPPASRSPAGRPRAPAPTGPIDLNRATESELARLPGVGPVLASRITAARPFADVDELSRVKGVRRATLDRLRPHLTVSSP
jgi:DNA uptake protein ComE-like DNA-binding protein